MSLSTTLRRNWVEVTQRAWNWAYNGISPVGIAPPIAALNSEGVLGLNYSATQPTAQTPPTGTTGMIGLDTSNVVRVPALNSTAATQIGAAGLTTTIVNPTITQSNGTFVNPATYKTVQYNETLNASIGTTPFFIADQAYQVVAVNYVNKTAGTVAGASVTLTKDTGTSAPGAGTALLTAPITCLAVANTVTPGTLVASTTTLTLAAGDRLSALFAGTLTTLAGVVLEVSLIPLTSASETTQVFWRANGDIKTTFFFQANRDMVVTKVTAVYGTAFAGAVTIDITKDTGTTAAGSGTSILTAAMAGDGTINTVLTPALAASAATLAMAAGDRLSTKFSATTTGALLCITVTFQPIYARKEIVWQLAPTAQEQVAQCFFIADRAYEIVDASEIHDVIASGAANIAVTIDKGTTIPGGGNIVQTDNTNAGFDLTGTARTTQFMTPASLHLRLLSPGDRLGLKVTGAAQSVADVCITCSLRPWY